MLGEMNCVLFLIILKQLQSKIDFHLIVQGMVVFHVSVDIEEETLYVYLKFSCMDTSIPLRTIDEFGRLMNWPP